MSATFIAVIVVPLVIGSLVIYTIGWHRGFAEHQRICEWYNTRERT